MDFWQVSDFSSLVHIKATISSYTCDLTTYLFLPEVMIFGSRQVKIQRTSIPCNTSKNTDFLLNLTLA